MIDTGRTAVLVDFSGVDYITSTGLGVLVASRLKLSGGQIKVEIIDDARPFDPRRVKAPKKKGALKELPLGGRGVYLVRSYVDDFGYQRKHGRNHVTVTKIL